MSKNQKHLEIGHIKIHGPTFSDKKCSIFEDLAELFKCETNFDAAKLLKDEWELLDKKGKIDLDSESDFVSILMAKSQSIDLAILINKLAGKNIDKKVITSAKKELKTWKQPEAFLWKAGDVFYIGLTESIVVYGQVLSDDDKMPTCALFSYFTKTPTNNIDAILSSKAITILHVSDDYLNDQSWVVIGNRTSSLDISAAPCGISGEIGSKYWDGLKILARAWHGLDPWNRYYKENYLDEKLLEGVSRPDKAVVLNRIDLETLGVSRPEWV
jgi:hypothetical protein